MSKEKKGHIGHPWHGYYLTAYEIALKYGFEGTEEEWNAQNGANLAAAQEAAQAAEAAQRAAESAQEAAEAAQAGTEGAAEEIEGYKNAAETARSAAENAQAEAESAKREAETARGAAQSARAEAEAAQTGAEAAQLAAETAKGGALTAKNDAQLAAEEAQAAQAAVESALTDAEAAKTGAVTAKNTALTAEAEARRAQIAAEAAMQEADEILESVEAAQLSAQKAREGAESAEANSEVSAALSQSWAVGGTGTREGENTNNARYWAESAAAAAAGGVASFNGRAGIVSPQAGDYTPQMVGAEPKLSNCAIVGTTNGSWTVNDCDYLCTGTDDVTVIETAIDAIKQLENPECILLPGTYHITRKIGVEYDDVVLRGTGGDTVLDISDVTVPPWMDDSCGLTIRGAKAAITDMCIKGAGTTGVCGVEAGSGTRLERLALKNLDAGVKLIGSDCIVQGCRFSNCGNGCEIDGNDAMVIDCRASNCTVFAAIGDSTERSCVSRNSIYKCGTGIRTDGSYALVFGNVLNNCTVGMDLNGTDHAVIGNMSYSILTKNIYPNTVGIKLTNCEGCLVEGNRLHDTRYSQLTTRYSILLEGAGNNNNLIAYNLILGKDYVTQGGSGNDFTGNKYQ